MHKLDFQISAEAIQYLKSNLLATHADEPLVLTIAPTTHPEIVDLHRENIEMSELFTIAKRHLSSLPPQFELQWSIGATYKSRLPKQHMFVISGIECFFPPDVQSAIKGRVLRIEHGELVFDPRLDPPAYSGRS